MIYRNAGELILLLKKEKLWTQKKLGQNFLVNPEVLQKIIASAELTVKDYVVEVGPGLGILTTELAQTAKKVTAIELDRHLIPPLKKNLAGFDNVEIKNQDALETRLPTETYKLVANIPYYITSPLLNHYLQPKSHTEKRPSRIVLLVQKEVAQKICAKDKNQSLLSLEVKIFGDPEIAGIVHKSSFFPQPKVDSAIIVVSVHEQPRIKDIKTFFVLAKAAFSQKRKTLSNSLTRVLKQPRETIENALKKANIAAQRRPETLTLQEWEQLVDAFKKNSIIGSPDSQEL
jgi:16S rRNA (adenine1518-N6/adenine1519-N6)-dimethyltransferase